jgi:hypothetical protein
MGKFPFKIQEARFDDVDACESIIPKVRPVDLKTGHGARNRKKW